MYLNICICKYFVFVPTKEAQGRTDLGFSRVSLGQVGPRDVTSLNKLAIALVFETFQTFGDKGSSYISLYVTFIMTPMTINLSLFTSMITNQLVREQLLFISLQVPHCNITAICIVYEVPKNGPIKIITLCNNKWNIG